MSEMAVPEVNKRLLGELQEMGFPLAQATRALHFSDNSSIDAAVNWLFDHQNDPDIDQMPLERRRSGKELLEAKSNQEENERKRNIALRKAEKEQEKKDRDRIRQKLQQDKAERRRMLGLPVEDPPPSIKSASNLMQQVKVPVTFVTVPTTELMVDCLRSLKRNHKDDGTKARRAFQTLLIYVGNVARNPDEEKFRKIRISNPAFQERVGNMKEGTEFLELCGFEIVGGKFLFLPRDKVDMEVLKSAGTALNSAITNPFFGLLSK
ncbi:uncharacterized protein LOC131320186 isoform X3 [Rhododendron vialii]|uniref:uncharacterized protein LOC131320186 isoform X3 n=1 Tax=Rhododendron vialii TaxID=182163 RepID=UPI00265E8860|nr:uncharacterized protein LOC131320186 isoform X3 [Rhododendron vialii]